MSTNAKISIFHSSSFLVFIWYNFLYWKCFLIVEDCKNTHTPGNKRNSSCSDTNIYYFNPLQAHIMTRGTIIQEYVIEEYENFKEYIKIDYIMY